MRCGNGVQEITCWVRFLAPTRGTGPVQQGMNCHLLPAEAD